MNSYISRVNKLSTSGIFESSRGILYAASDCFHLRLRYRTVACISSPRRPGGSCRRDKVQPEIWIQQAHEEVLSKFSSRIHVHSSMLEDAPKIEMFRFPTVDFKALALSVTGKLSPLDPSFWKNWKVPLCELLLVLEQDAIRHESCTQNALHPSDEDTFESPGTVRGDLLKSTEVTTWPRCRGPGTQYQQDSSASCSTSHEIEVLIPESVEVNTSSPYQEQWKADIGSKRFRSALREFLDTWFGNDEEQFDKLLSNPHIPPEQIAEIKRKFDTRKDNRRRQVTEWCKATFEHPDFPHVRPLLKQMLEVTPVPVVDHRKDGAKTEGLIYDLVLRELPEGWRLYNGARLLKVDGEPFPNKKLLKGEADLLLVDPLGIVQAVIEVKTASGNIFLALHEDVIRLSALINLVRGRRVQFSPADRSVVTLQFSPLLTPVYVLGCEVDSSEVSSLVKRAYGKLSTVELARMLSTQVHQWESINVLEMSPAAMTLNISDDLTPSIHQNIKRYFEALETCQIYALKAVEDTNGIPIDDKFCGRIQNESRPYR